MRKLTLVIAIMAAGSDQALAWWETGHTAINRTAVATLPREVPDFLRRHIDWIGERSLAPDYWRDAREPSLKAIEEPNHVWYALDQRNAYEDAGSAEARELVYLCTSEAAAMQGFDLFRVAGEREVSNAFSAMIRSLHIRRLRQSSGWASSDGRLLRP